MNGDLSICPLPLHWSCANGRMDRNEIRIKLKIKLLFVFTFPTVFFFCFADASLINPLCCTMAALTRLFQSVCEDQTS